MKKFAKIMAIVLAMALTAAVSVSLTLAYLTDTDEQVNVMTLGNVSIKQHEYERVVNTDGTYEMVTSAKYGEGYKVQPFTQAKPLYPGVGAVTNYGKAVFWDQLGAGASGGQLVLDGIENVQDKFILVENTGKSDAYVRTLVAFEAGSVTDLTKFTNTVVYSDSATGNPWSAKWVDLIQIDGTNYWLREYVYTGSNDGSRHAGGVLPAGEYTYSSLAQIYMMPTATNEDCIALDGNNNGTYDILVVSQAVQTEGFANAETALDTAFGDITTINHPWADEAANIPVIVKTAEELSTALTTGKEVFLANDVTMDADNTIAISAGKTATLNLNGHTLSATADGTGNREMFLVKGKLTVVGGTIKMNATTNQGWGAMTTVFDITAGGAVNIENAYIENLGGSDMAFVAHLNNWGEATLNVNNSTLKSTYMAVRVFNSGYDMNNVTITNSTLGGKYGLWVHNYTKADFGTDEKAAAQAELLNFDVFNGTNTFDTVTAPARYGFTDSLMIDANGNVITG